MYHEIEDGRFFWILVYNDKIGPMRKMSFYSVDKVKLKRTLVTLYSN